MKQKKNMLSNSEQDSTQFIECSQLVSWYENKLQQIRSHHWLAAIYQIYSDKTGQNWSWGLTQDPLQQNVVFAKKNCPTTPVVQQKNGSKYSNIFQISDSSTNLFSFWY